jgi:transposase-like protein
MNERRLPPSGGVNAFCPIGHGAGATAGGPAGAAFEQFGESWRAKYPLIYQSCDAAWPNLREFFKYPEEIRRAVCTANAIESLNCQLRKVARNRSVLANDGAIYKIMYLTLRNAAKKWTTPVKDWETALSQFAVFFGDRVPAL